MILKIYDDGRMAEIVTNTVAKPPISAAELARLMLAHGITAAKIIKSKPATGDPAINVARNAKETF